MQFKYWTQTCRLFVISNVMLVTMVLCLTALFLPYWYTVDFGMWNHGPPVDIIPTKPPSTTSIKPTPAVPSTQPTTTSSNMGRRKRHVSLDWITTTVCLLKPSHLQCKRRRKRRQGSFKKQSSSFIERMPTALKLRYKRQAMARGKTFDSLNISAVNVGLFYMEYPYADFKTLEVISYRLVSLIHLEKTSSGLVVPETMYVGQVFYSIGMFGLTICCAGIFILACRKYGSVTGEIATAGVLTFSAVSLVIGVAFAGVQKEGDVWDNFPVMNTVVMKSRPIVQLNWGFYFAMCGPLVSVFCSVLMWTQACSTCFTVEEIRHKQLNDINSPNIHYQPLVTNKKGHVNTGMRNEPAPQAPPLKLKHMESENSNEFSI